TGNQSTPRDAGDGSSRASPRGRPARGRAFAARARAASRAATCLGTCNGERTCRGAARPPPCRRRTSPRAAGSVAASAENPSSGRPSRAPFVEQPHGDSRAVLARVTAERLDRKRALVVAVQHVFPREADAAVHLDRTLAGGNGNVRGEALRGGDGNRRLLIVLRDAPGRPVGERPRELRL